MNNATLSALRLVRLPFIAISSSYFGIISFSLLITGLPAILATWCWQSWSATAGQIATFNAAFTLQR